MISSVSKAGRGSADRRIQRSNEAEGARMREMTVPAQYLQIAADVASRVAAGDLPEG